MTRNGYKRVQMDLREPTIEKVEEIRRVLNAPNRTGAVVSSIDVTSLLVRAVRDREAKVILELPSGERERLVIPGLS